MKLYHSVAVVVGLLTVLSGVSSTALADTADARCEVHRKGDLKKNKSGPCTFSQRQGYVTITLLDGTVWDLKPTDKANRFKDKDGHKVKRTANGQEHKYKWEHRSIKVDFSGG